MLQFWFEHRPAPHNQVNRIFVERVDTGFGFDRQALFI
jgi:hypothetical protein